MSSPIFIGLIGRVASGIWHLLQGGLIVWHGTLTVCWEVLVFFLSLFLSPVLRKQMSLWVAGDMERSKNREMMKHAQEKPDKLSKAEKLDKLERLERMERSEKVGRLEAQMLSKIRAGVDTMVLDGKEMEYLMEGDIMVCREFTELYAVLHTILKKRCRKFGRGVVMGLALVGSVFILWW